MEIRANPALEWKPEFMAASDTLYGMADKVKFRRDDLLPRILVQAAAHDRGRCAGRLRRQASDKLVWYLVYRVRNTGQVLKPVEGEDGVYSAATGQGRPGSLPAAVCFGIARSPGDGERVSKSYLDRVIPAAVAAISQRETPGQHAAQQRRDLRAADPRQRRPHRPQRVGRGDLGRRRSAYRLLLHLRRRPHERLPLDR